MRRWWWWPWRNAVVVAMERCCDCGHGEMMMMVAMGFALDA